MMTTQVNLIPTRHREQRALRARRRDWTRVVIAYAMVVLIGFAGWRVVWSSDGRDLSRQVSLAHGDLDDANKSINRLRATVNETQLILRANHAVNGQPDWSVLLSLIAHLRGNEVVLNRCALDSVIPPPQAGAATSDVITTPLLKLHGYGKTQAAVSQFALRLEQTGLFESVSLLKTNREAFLAGEAIAFQLECRIRVSANPPPPAKARPMALIPHPRGATAAMSNAGETIP